MSIPPTPHSSSSGLPARILDLERADYPDVLALMRALVDARCAGMDHEVLLMVEHPPVLTMGRRSRPEEIRVPPDRLQRNRIAVHRVERGGLITYHGPGQLVVYPVFDLKALGTGVRLMVADLETVIVDTLADFGLRARLREGYRGVWVGAEKIASIGIAVRHGVTYHGLALNCDPDLTHFELITPCGLTGVQMTSMARILGRPLALTDVKAAVRRHFENRFGLCITPWSLGEARDLLARVQSV